ncbi:ABC transporter permease [Simiduia curdlanivorans]|uniref:MlaE family ABC transporter permease n=1 Tax=Simiduia curdlanivorans TaxID=1492769 RepID=A0ABV8V108_9GAMM|nr:ABC transporter permease [Simiduia curdlanivorans]MDN3637587.1 ABC transporter permease [Simiduia curdlanivorans]
MSETTVIASYAEFRTGAQQHELILSIRGDWHLGEAPEGGQLCALLPPGCTSLSLNTAELGRWDSSLAIALLQLARRCNKKNISFHYTQSAPALVQLLKLALDVPEYEQPHNPVVIGWRAKLRHWLTEHGQSVKEHFIFVGDVCLACVKWASGGANTRASDILYFIRESGPKALPIVTLISLLVGMILAYLGAIQLRQLGAQVYVADLVSLGMVREMGALMTAVIMAGRTGAAYAAQLGTMQVNEEIDALKVMGVSSLEFLVLPRLLALILTMPLLTIYANTIGMLGGALITTSMDVSYTQYILQTQQAVDWLDISTGLLKSLVFGVLIAMAGCHAGIRCGRNSTAVGLATTNAVVSAIVYLVVADAAFNIIYDKLGI